MKKTGIVFITAMVLLCGNRAVAQIGNEIRNYVDSTELLLDNGRKLLLDNLAKEDNKKANEIYAYLINLTKDKGYKAFYYSEVLLVNILSQNFTEFLDKAENYATYVKDARYNTNVPLNDVLHQEIGKRKERIENAIVSSDRTDEEKQILLIFLKLVNESNRDDDYFTMVRNYKKQYAVSKYSEFIEKYIPGPRVKAAWNSHMGAAWLFPTGKLADNFSNGVGFSFGMDFNIGKVYASLRMTGGTLLLKQPYLATTQYGSLFFGKDDSFSYFDGGLELGYFLVRSDRFQIAPHASISGNNLRSSYYESEDSKKEIDIYNCAALGVGLHSEVKIFQFEQAPYYGYGYPMKSYISVKLDVGYQWLTKFENTNFTGNMAYAKLAFVWGFGDF